MRKNSLCRRSGAVAHALFVLLIAAAGSSIASDSSKAQEGVKSGETLPKDCRDCPEMVVVPAGRFLMGLASDGDDNARPQHEVTIPKPFAVGKFEVTFDEWDACAKSGACAADISDNGWGRGRRPVINVNFDDARAYLRWLSKTTGHEYRLLSEAEYEYAARAGDQKLFPWGDDFKLDGRAMANCELCGSPWDGKQTAPVCGWQEEDAQKPAGCAFPANAFGLYDMEGNVWEWLEDCWSAGYQGAPADGSPRKEGDCSIRAVRGGSWDSDPDDLRSGNRYMTSTDVQAYNFGFRVAHTLPP